MACSARAPSSIAGLIPLSRSSRPHRRLDARATLWMSGIPMRAQAVEKMLVGKPLNKDSFAEAAACIDKDFMPLTDMRGSAEYRLQAARNLVLKYGLELTGTVKIDLANQAASKMTIGLQC